MLARIRPHLSYANVMVTLLAFVVLGGVSYAAFKLPNDSVKSKHIKDEQIQSKDVRNDDLTGADVNESQLGEVPSAANADLLDGQDSQDIMSVRAIANFEELEGSFAIGAKLCAEFAIDPADFDPDVVPVQLGDYALAFPNPGLSNSLTVTGAQVQSASDPNDPPGIPIRVCNLSDSSVNSPYRFTAIVLANP